MKGKLLIEPGFEAGSESCKGCELFELDYMHSLVCYFGVHQEHFYGKEIDPSKFKRLTGCLDAEIKKPETPTPPPIRIIQEDKFSSGELKMILFIVVVVAVLFAIYHL